MDNGLNKLTLFFVIFVAVALISGILSSCKTSKVDKAVNLLSRPENKDRAAKFCNSAFPLVVIGTSTETKDSSAEHEQPAVIQFVNCDSALRASLLASHVPKGQFDSVMDAFHKYQLEHVQCPPCPPQQTKEYWHTTTIRDTVLDTRQIAALQAQLNAKTKEANEWHDKAMQETERGNKWRKWFFILLAITGVYSFFKWGLPLIIKAATK